MPGHLSITPSQIPAGHHAEATYQACGETRYLLRSYLIEKAGDVPLSRIEPRLRCIARKRDKHGPACGGRMVIGLYSLPINDRPADDL